MASLSNNCQECPVDYFCCKLRVKLSWREAFKIWFKGYTKFSEVDEENNLVLKRKNGQCLFLDQNCQCKIYSLRPRVCRNFPAQECQEKYQQWRRFHQPLTSTKKNDHNHQKE